MMLTKEEIQVSEIIAKKIVSDCISHKKGEEALACVKERISGMSYMLDAAKSLPANHPMKKQMSRIHNIIESVKGEIFIIIIPER